MEANIEKHKLGPWKSKGNFFFSLASWEKTGCWPGSIGLRLFLVIVKSERKYYLLFEAFNWSCNCIHFSLKKVNQESGLVVSALSSKLCNPLICCSTPGKAWNFFVLKSDVPHLPLLPVTLDADAMWKNLQTKLMTSCYSAKT